MHRGLPRVACPICGRQTIVNDIDLRLRAHGPRNERCSGSGRLCEHATEVGATWGGASQGACSCGWEGPVRSVIEAAARDCQIHLDEAG